MTIPVFISKLIPIHGDDIYDGCRVAVFNTRREALEDLYEWTGDDELAENLTDADLEQHLGECDEIISWGIEEQTLDTNERPGV